MWPANYNCPGQIVISGENEAVEECCAEAESLGARRAVRLRVSGAFHSPLVARAADRLRPGDRAGQVRGADRAVHVHGDRPHRARAADGRAARRPADRAGAVHAGGARADRARASRRSSRSGPGNVLSGLLKRIDRSVKAVSVNSLESLEKRRGGTLRCLSAFCVARGARRALVTGASRGIGRAIALELGRAGASVVVGYRSGAEEAEAVAAEIGGRAVQADVSDPESAKALVEAAGDLDILVNNAGLTRDGLLLRMSDDDWRAVIETNLSSVFYTCRAAARGMMRKRAGAIVNVSSIVGVHGNPGQTNYSASKAGIIGFTKSLARELGSRNVRANVVAPGLRRRRS